MSDEGIHLVYKSPINPAKVPCPIDAVAATTVVALVS